MTDLAQMTPDEKRSNRRDVARRFLIGGGVASVIGNLADTLLSGGAYSAAGTEPWRAGLSIFISIAVSVAVPLVFIAFVDYIIKLEGVEVRSLWWHRLAVFLTLILAAVTFAVSFTKLWNLLDQLPGESHYAWLTVALAATPDITMTIATLFMHTLSEAPKRRAKARVEREWLGINEHVRRAFKGTPKVVERAETPHATPTPPAQSEPRPRANSQVETARAPIAREAEPTHVEPTDEHHARAARLVEARATQADARDVARALAMIDANAPRDEIERATGIKRDAARRLITRDAELSAPTDELADLEERRLSAVG